MNNMTQFDLMLDAMTELVQEEQAKLKSPLTHSQPALPSLTSILEEISPLPAHTLFLGMAEDDLPVLLNLHDPVPGPILIAGDENTGKTKLLQTFAHAVELTALKDETQYIVVTNQPEEWKQFENKSIYQTNDYNTKELLQSLVTWAHNNKGGQESVLLLIDNLEAMTQLDAQSQQNLRWLLLRGTTRRVWACITVDAKRAFHLKDWLEFFHTRLFARVADADTAYLLTGSREHSLAELNQYAMRENDALLNFYAPTIN